MKNDSLELLEEVIKVFDVIGRNTFNEVVKVSDYL